MKRSRFRDGFAAPRAGALRVCSRRRLTVSISTGGPSLKTFGCGLVVLLLWETGPGAGGIGRQPPARWGGRAAGRRKLRPGSTSARMGAISVFTGKAEVGQNIRTSLTQVVAEELHAPSRSIRLIMADTDQTPFDAGTFGSPDHAGHGFAASQGRGRRPGGAY